MKALLCWIDERTGLITTLDQRLNRPIAGGPRWRYVLPATLLFAFILQAVTGVFLWMFYSPSAQNAWESVFWVQEGLWGGWLLRGIHFYAANVMLVLAGLYVLQLILTGWYRAPREVLFWLSLAVFGMLLGLMLTGDLMRWDQEGYYSTQVRTHFLTLLPLIGDKALKLAIGGSEFGHLTLTRFFALHGGVLSVALLVLLLWQGALLRRHGLCYNMARTGSYWPGQALRNFLACAAVLAAILYLTVQNQHQGDHAGLRHGQYLGAPLGSPADPSEDFKATRPEWAFLPLYAFNELFLKKFGAYISWGGVPVFVIPGILALLLILMPWIGRRTLGHLFNILLVLGLLGGSVWLAQRVVKEDSADAQHQAILAQEQADAQRAKQLAYAQGVPPAGAASLLHNDAKTQGRRLFTQHCASCHSCVNAQGEGVRAESPSAPNLYHFASRPWIQGILDRSRIKTADYFGNTKFASGQMVGHVRDTLKDLLADKDDGPKVKHQLELAAMALSAEAQLPSQHAADAADAQQIEEGRRALGEEIDCLSCHRFNGKGATLAPDLTGYGSRPWMTAIVSNPADKRFYGPTSGKPGNDRMPAYAESATDPAKNLLTTHEIELLVDWLRGEWYEPAK